MSVAGVVDWAALGRPIPGELESGDLHVAVEYPGGALLGVIDGLGHGPEAAQSSRIAAAVLSATPDRPVRALIEACHEALRGARGAVISLAAVDAEQDRLTWIGVGNVEAVLNRTGDRTPRRERILLRGGVVGYQLPPLREVELPLFPGDVLVMATDGLRHEFAEVEPDTTPMALAHRLISGFAKMSDDAHVLVARYRGRSA